MRLHVHFVEGIPYSARWTLLSELSRLLTTNQVIDSMCECLSIYERVVLPSETEFRVSAFATLAGLGPVGCCCGCQPCQLVSPATPSHVQAMQNTWNWAKLEQSCRPYQDDDSHSSLLLGSTTVLYGRDKTHCGMVLGWGGV